MTQVTQRRSLLPVLMRHCFSRFFDTEMAGNNGEMQANVVQAIAIAAVPGAFYSSYTILHYSIGVIQPYRSWIGVTDRYLFLCFSMVVIGLAATIEWKAFFPDRRDYLILTPLPVPKRALFLAKFLALLGFLTAAAVMTNLCSTILYPMFGAPGGTLEEVSTIMLAHVVTMTTSAAFVVFSVAGVHGLLVTFTKGRVFQFLSGLCQGLAFAAFSMLLLFFPFLSFAVKNLIQYQSAALFCIPPCWFLGLYEVLLPGHARPIYYQLARFGLEAVAVACSAYFLTYLIGYKRFSRTMSSEAPIVSSTAVRWLKRSRSLVYRVLLRDPAEHATYEFIGKLLWRTSQNRGFLAAYAGVAIGFSVLRAYDIDVRDGRLLVSHSQASLFSIPLILSFLFLTGLRAALSFPSELRANWIFQLSRETIRHGCLSGVRKWLLVRIVFPIFAINSVCELGHSDWWTVVFHLCFGVVLSALLVESILWDYRSVPFAASPSARRVNLALAAVIYGFAFLLFSYKSASWAETLSQYKDCRVRCSDCIVARSMDDRASATFPRFRG